MRPFQDACVEPSVGGVTRTAATRRNKHFRKPIARLADFLAQEPQKKRVGVCVPRETPGPTLRPLRLALALHVLTSPSSLSWGSSATAMDETNKFKYSNQTRRG